MKYVLLVFYILAISCQKATLTESDLDLNGKEAISSTLLAKDPWKSSYYWYCYPSQLLSVTTFVSKNKKFPQIEINYHHFKIKISLYSDVESDLASIPATWNQIVASDQQTCLYLVHLPDNEALKVGEMFFYIERMKTSKLSWVLDEKI